MRFWQGDVKNMLRLFRHCMNCSPAAEAVEEAGELVAERLVQLRKKGDLAASAAQLVAVALLYTHHELKLLPEAGLRSRFLAAQAGRLAVAEQLCIRP